MFGGRAPDSPQTVWLTGDGTGEHPYKVHLTSLWFDANAGRDYTLKQSHPDNAFADMGWHLADNGQLITVLGAPFSQEADHQAHINIEVPIVLANNVADRYRWISNYSLGTLRLGGTLDLGSQHLKIGGIGATHIAGNITSAADQGHAYVINAVPNPDSKTSPTQLILSGDNSGWSGHLNAGKQTMVIFNSAQAIALSGDNWLWTDSGGSFVLRGSGTYNPTRALRLTGDGAVRQAQYAQGIGALYYDGTDNATSITYNGGIALYGDTRIGARGDSGSLTLNGQITQSDTNASYGLTKNGLGLVVLNNASNAWKGPTTIEGGVLRITQDGSLPSPSAIVFQSDATTTAKPGGVLELAYGSTHNLSLGTGTGKFNWLGSGGFSAYGGERTVTLNNGAALTWNTGGFVGTGKALLLGSRYANSVITLTNQINLGANREIHVARGSLNAYAVLSGELSGTGTGVSGSGITKTGTGLLELASSNNSYTGLTTIREGSLLGNIPSASNIRLSGGVLGLSSDFTRSLGTGAGQVRWQAPGGGFAAYGGDRVVRLNNNTNQINWTANNFVGNNGELRFGHYTATGTVIWDKKLSWTGNRNRIIHVERGLDPNIADVVFNQTITSTRGNLIIRGNGRMDIAVANPSLALASLVIHGVELTLNKEGTIHAAGQIDLDYGATLTLDNRGTHKSTTGGSYESNRVNDTSDIYLLGGDTLHYIGREGGSSLEEVGSIDIGHWGANIIHLEHISTGVSDFTELRIDSIIRSQYGTLNYITNTEDFSKVRLSLSGTLPTIGGIGYWGTVNGKDFIAPVDVGEDIRELRPYNNYETDSTNWSDTSNVYIGTDHTLSDSLTVNSLKLGDTTLDLGGKALTFKAQALLTYDGDPTIKGGIGSIIQRPSKGGHLYLHTYSSNLTVEGNVQLDGFKMIKTGPGTLILNSMATHTPDYLYVRQGTVDLQQGGIQTTRIYIGDGSGTDILKLPANRSNPITGLNGGPLPSITIRGNPYSLPHDLVYERGDEAILQFGGGTQQQIADLTISGHGVIDWLGGNGAAPNILWMDELRFSTNDSLLFMRNWVEFEDYFLISKSWFDRQNTKALLRKIVFDGYQDYEVKYRHYDNEYWEITPFDNISYSSPEPTVTGALVGAIGLGLVVWRRKRRVASPTCAARPEVCIGQSTCESGARAGAESR